MGERGRGCGMVGGEVGGQEGRVGVRREMKERAWEYEWGGRKGE